jgi:hypothetical protein
MAGSSRQSSSRDGGVSVPDVLAYLDWWDSMLWFEELRADPSIEWQRDLSFDEIAEMVGVEAPRLAPGDVPAGEDLAIPMYWPGEPPR